MSEELRQRIRDHIELNVFLGVVPGERWPRPPVERLEEPMLRPITEAMKKWFGQGEQDVDAMLAAGKLSEDKLRDHLNLLSDSPWRGQMYNNDPTPTLGSELRKFRRADPRGLSLVDTAQAAGITVPRMSDVERGTVPLAQECLTALLKFLGMPDEFDRLRALPQGE